jgi:putative transposase
MSVLSADYGVRQMCELLDLNPSTFYYTAQSDPDDVRLVQALRSLAGKHPSYGYRRLTELVRRGSKRLGKVNGKRVRRLMKQAGLSIKRRKRAPRTTNSEHGFQRYPNRVADLVIERPDQVWVCDITAIVLADSRVVYLAIVMDVFTRAIRGWDLSRDITHALTLSALQCAFKHGQCEIHHSDQGVQYATPKYTCALVDRGIQISMAAVGKAWENGYAERWFRSAREEEVTLTEYIDYADADRHLGKLIDAVYNRKRIHSALGYLTPAEFEAHWHMQQGQS